MSNEVKVQGEKVPIVPESRDVFECAGDAMTQGNTIIGDLLKFSKGDWLAGPDAEEIEAETELVAVVPGTVHGWVRWEGTRRAEQIMGLLIEGFVHRHARRSATTIRASGRSTPTANRGTRGRRRSTCR